LWLRRVMLRVAIVAAALFILRLLFRGTWLYGDNFFGNLLGVITFCTIFFTIVYYGFKSLLWLKRRLLWRVRRRLVVTYLFVGLTPIVLLILLGLLSAFGGSTQAMSRIIISQLNATEREAQANARALADGFARLPPTTDDRAAQAWLEERAAMLRASLPGARIVVWRGNAGEDVNAGLQSRAQFLSDLNDEQHRGVGKDNTPLDAPLPEWMRGRSEWSGLTYSASPDERDDFGSPSVRAVARSSVEGRTVTLMLVVPISRALVQEYRERTGIYLRPHFLSAGVRTETGRMTRIQTRKQENAEREAQERDRPFSRDQFGEPTTGTSYIVVGPATNWANGENKPHLLFLFDWSWAVASKQFLGGTELGRVWQQALKGVAITFLVFEVLALLAAAWMTRAVTGTVHKLYRATEFIKRGDFSHRVHVRSGDQLGELATAFNEMSSNIEVLLQERVEHERLEREVEIAAEVQARLFPGRVPELMTVEIAAECRAARGVAGDYYDYIEVAPGLVALALGDVSGKGVSASLVMSNLQASLRAQAAITAERLSIAERAVAVSAGGDGSKVLARVMADADMEGSVARKVTNINKQLCQSTEGNRFATLFLAIYEDRTRTLRYSNAGHNAAVLVRADGTAERLSRGGMMVGAFDWAEYEEVCTTLQPGDLLLIFSDGLSEAEGENGEEYGEERIARFTIEHRTLSAHDLRHALFDEVDRWSGERERGDDQTLLIVKANE
jgi:sigma-B regulation protein RsbU (phosphoserine phosphatase)